MIELKRDNCVLQISRDFGRQGRANQYYSVTLVSGEWPTDSDLITYCDNGSTSMQPMHFGGFVKILDPSNKYVTVYVD
jgi:hypothetical protein